MLTTLRTLLAGQPTIEEPELDHKPLAAKLEALGAVYAVVELDADGYFKDANDRFLEAVQYSRSELMGEHHRRLVAPEEARSAEYEAFWRELRAGHGRAAEFKRIRKDGSPIWLRAAYCPIKCSSGSVEGVIKLALDTTLERQALDRGQGVVELSLDGHVLDANEMFLGMVDYTLGELRGQHHRALVDPAFATSEAYEAHWRRLRRGEFVAGTFERRGKGGCKIYMRASYNPVFDQDGHLRKIVKYATDVTALRTSLDEIREVVTDLGGSTTSLAASSTQLGSTAKATQEQATAMRGRADEIAAAMQSVSAATEELSSSVAEIAKNSATAASEAKAGEAAAEAASYAVEELNGVSHRISSVVDLIKDIADQTNLLALNATIEAASAGAAGRGFKVVADEVKTLSNETAKATGEIAAQIGDIVRIARTSTEAVEKLSAVIKGLVQRQTALAVTAEEQQAVTTEIAGHAGRVATSMTEASEEVSTLTASAEHAQSVAGAIAGAVELLSQVSGRLEGLTEHLRDK